MDELVQRIIKRRVAADDSNDIILDICEETGMTWNEAEAFVQRVIDENQNPITLKQSPLLVLLALVIFAGGLATLGIAALKTYDFFKTILSTDSGPIASVGISVYLIEYLPYLMGYITLGISMIAGSLFGMQKIWEAIFHHFKINF